MTLPILILYLPHNLPYGRGGTQLDAYEAFSLFETYLKANITGYHILVFMGASTQDGFRLEVLNTTNVSEADIKELKKQLKDQLELYGIDHRNQVRLHT